MHVGTGKFVRLGAAIAVSMAILAGFAVATLRADPPTSKSRPFVVEYYYKAR